MARATKQADRRRPKKPCTCTFNRCNEAPGGQRLLGHSAWYEHQRQEREAQAAREVQAAREAAAAQEVRQQIAALSFSGDTTVTGPRSGASVATGAGSHPDPHKAAAPGAVANAANPQFSAGAAANEDDHGITECRTGDIHDGGADDNNGNNDLGGADLFMWDDNLDWEAVGAFDAGVHGNDDELDAALQASNSPPGGDEVLLSEHELDDLASEAASDTSTAEMLEDDDQDDNDDLNSSEEAETEEDSRSPSEEPEAVFAAIAGPQPASRAASVEPPGNVTDSAAVLTANLFYLVVSWLG
ncbi:hypothetical protein JCM3774_005836 [Rhodotorula dairenensis]